MELVVIYKEVAAADAATYPYQEPGVILVDETNQMWFPIPGGGYTKLV